MGRATTTFWVWLWLAGCLNCSSGRGADVRRVPEGYPSVLAAYAAAQAGDVIEVNAKLTLEIPPVVFEAGKPVTFRTGIGRAIISANVPPSNDTFSGRTVITGENTSSVAANYSAALAPEEGDPLPRAAGGDARAFGRSLWFEWTAPGSGLAIVNTVGSDFDTLMDVFNGVSPPLKPVNSAWFGFNEVGFNALQGQTYAILVGGQNRAFGEVRLNISYAAPPPNDNFTNAHSLIGDVTQVQGSTFGASQEIPLELDHAAASGSHSVWFTWTAPSNEGLFARPVTFSTAGSDFDTVLAVYEGTSLTTLTLRTNNNDRFPGLRESLVTFTPAPGNTYHIALDGAALSGGLRDHVGNYLLRVDHSLVNVILRNLKTEDPVNQQVGFRGDLIVRDWGIAPTASLRVRLAARAGRDFAGVHRAAASNEVTLATYSIPNGLLPNETQTVAISSKCPGPIVDNSLTNIWGVFAIVEEAFAGVWVPLDRLFLLYGFVPETGRPILSYGVGRPVPPELTKNEINSIESTDVRLVNYVIGQSTNVFSIIARLENGEERSLTNTVTWRGPSGIDLKTNGVLRVGEVLASTTFMVTGSYNLGGAKEIRTSSIGVYRHPILRFLSAREDNSLSYEIQSDFPAVYSLEFRPQLESQVTQTYPLGLFSSFPVTNILMNVVPGFYRMNASPLR